MTKSCYDCELWLICRIRSKASEFIDYCSNTGNIVPDIMVPMYDLLGSQCQLFKDKEDEK